MIVKFQKENPNYKISQQVLGWDQMYEKTIVSLAANKPPDVFIIHHTQLEYAHQCRPLRAVGTRPQLPAR